jgi:heat shock protein HtpX
MLADFFRQITWRTSPDSKDSDKGGGWVTVVLIVLAMVVSIIAPIIARLLQLAVSRQREYLADATGVEFTRNPQALADALRRISADAHEL